MRASCRVLAFHLTFSFVIIFCVCWAHNEEYHFFPNPQVDHYRCGRRGQESWICDPERVLSYEDANEIDGILRSIRNDTGCSQCAVCKEEQHGYTVSVAIVKDAVDGLSTSGFAKYLLHEWNYGNCRDDVVIVLAAKTRQVYSAVGLTAEKPLEYGVYQDNIHEKVDPVIKLGDFADGLRIMTTEYRAAFLGRYKYTASFPLWPIVHICTAAAMISLCLIVVCWCKRGSL